MVLKVKQFAVFRDYSWGTGCGVSKLPTCSFNGPLMVSFQQAYTCDIYQLIHNFKTHAPSKRCTWGIDDSILQLLKSSVNCCPAKRLIRKMKIEFQKVVNMLNNGHPENWLITGKLPRLPLWKHFILKRKDHWFQKAYFKCTVLAYVTNVWHFLTIIGPTNWFNNGFPFYFFY